MRRTLTQNRWQRQRWRDQRFSSVALLYSSGVDSRSAPVRLRSLPSWLINKLAQTAQQVVTVRLAAADTHRHHYSMLSTLDEFGPASQATLGRRCGLDRSDVAAAVAHLAERQLVVRGPDQLDRRRNTVRITPAGLQHLVALDRLLSTAQDELLGPLSESERRQLVELLTRLVDHHGTAP